MICRCEDLGLEQYIQLLIHLENWRNDCYCLQPGRSSPRSPGSALPAAITSPSPPTRATAPCSNGDSTQMTRVNVKLSLSLLWGSQPCLLPVSLPTSASLRQNTGLLFSLMRSTHSPLHRSTDPLTNGSAPPWYDTAPAYQVHALTPDTFPYFSPLSTDSSTSFPVPGSCPASQWLPNLLNQSSQFLQCEELSSHAPSVTFDPCFALCLILCFGVSDSPDPLPGETVSWSLSQCKCVSPLSCVMHGTYASLTLHPQDPHSDLLYPDFTTSCLWYQSALPLGHLFLMCSCCTNTTNHHQVNNQNNFKCVQVAFFLHTQW